MTKKKRSDISNVECVSCHKHSQVHKYTDQCPHCKCTGCLLDNGRVKVSDDANQAIQSLLEDTLPPYENIVPAEYAHLLSEDMTDMLADNNLTIEIEAQQAPYRLMQNRVDLAGLPDLIPLYNPLADAIAPEDIKADKESTIDNIITVVSNNPHSSLSAGTQVASKAAVYTYDKDDRRHFTVYDNVAEANNAQFAGVVYSEHSFGNILAEVEKELGYLSNYANGDYMQFTLRNNGKFIDQISMVEKNTASFDTNIERKIKNIIRQNAYRKVWKVSSDA